MEVLLCIPEIGKEKGLVRLNRAADSGAKTD